LAQSRGVDHRSLVTPERVLSEYNKDLDLIFFIFRGAWAESSQRFAIFENLLLK